MGVYEKNKLCYILFQDTSIIIVNNDTAKYYVFKRVPFTEKIFSRIDEVVLTEEEISRLSIEFSEKSDIVLDFIDKLCKLKILLHIDDIESPNSHNLRSRFWTEILYLSKFTSKPYQLLDEIISKKVLVIGAGALGSSLVLKLSAIGIKYIYCIDGDRIELDNLTRQILYTPEDISDGLFKVEALNNMVKKFYPESNFLGIKQYINSYKDCLKYIPKDIDLIIQTADSPIGEIDDWINNFSLCTQIPVIYSHFGSVGPFVIPTKSPCLKCLNNFLDKKTDGLHSLTKRLFENKPNTKSPSFVTGTQINELLILDLVKKYWITGENEEIHNKVYTFYDGFSNIKEVEFPYSDKCKCKEINHG